MSKTCPHIELALYVDDMAIIATSRKPTLLISYLESYLNDLQRWLSEWRIAINVSKSTAIIFARAGRRFIQPQPVTLFGGTNRMGRQNSLSGGSPRYTTHLVASHRSGEEEDCAKGMLGPLLNRKSDLSIRNGVLLYKHFIRPMMDYACPAWRSAARPHVRRLQLLQSLSLTSKSLALAYSPVRVKVSVIEPSDAVKRRNG